MRSFVISDGVASATIVVIEIREQSAGQSHSAFVALRNHCIENPPCARLAFRGRENPNSRAGKPVGSSRKSRHIANLRPVFQLILLTVWVAEWLVQRRSIPDSFLFMAPSKIWPLMTTRILSPLGKLRSGLELLVSRKKKIREDESLKSFVTRRFGHESFSAASSLDASRRSFNGMGVPGCIESGVLAAQRTGTGLQAQPGLCAAPFGNGTRNAIARCRRSIPHKAVVGGLEKLSRKNLNWTQRRSCGPCVCDSNGVKTPEISVSHYFGDHRRALRDAPWLTICCLGTKECQASAELAEGGVLSIQAGSR